MMKTLTTQCIGFLVLLPYSAFGHSIEEKPMTPQQAIEAIRDIVNSDDLTDSDMLGSKLGLTFNRSPEELATGPDGASLGKSTAFALAKSRQEFSGETPGSFNYSIFQPTGKAFSRVRFQIPLNTSKLCVRFDHFNEAFGRSGKRYLMTDGAGPAYSYDFAHRNNIALIARFDTNSCMVNLSFLQNIERQN